MSLDSLPLQIVFAIARELRHDSRSLKALSLVSSSFLAVTRSFLFAKVRITSLNPSFNRRRDRLFRLFRSYPDALPHIHTLELGPPILRMGPNPISNFQTAHWDAVHRRQQPSIDDPRIQYIVDGAIGLRSLTLRFEYQDWNNFSPAFQQSVRNLIVRDSVTSLRIEDVVNFPFHILAECKHLKHLALAYVAQNTIPELDSVLGYRRPTLKQGSLRSLTLFESDACVEALVSLLNDPRSSLGIRHLKHLTINMTGTDGRSALEIIPRVSPAIDVLEVRVPQNHTRMSYLLLSDSTFPSDWSFPLVLSDAFSQFRLDSFQSLRTLYLNLGHISSWLFRDIRTFISTSNTIQELKLHFRHALAEAPLKLLVDPAVAPQWSRVDPRRLGLPHFQKIVWVLSPAQSALMNDIKKKVEVERFLKAPWDVVFIEVKPGE